jgi:hypothetical protein
VPTAMNSASPAMTSSVETDMPIPKTVRGITTYCATLSGHSRS